MRVTGDDECLDDVIADLYGATWLDAESWWFRPAARAYPAWRRPQPGGGALARGGRVPRTGDRTGSAAGRGAQAELKELRASVARGQRDTSRWREKAEQRRLEAVALRKAQERSFLGRATRRLRKLVRDSP